QVVDGCFQLVIESFDIVPILGYLFRRFDISHRLDPIIQGIGDVAGRLPKRERPHESRVTAIGVELGTEIVARSRFTVTVGLRARRGGRVRFTVVRAAAGDGGDCHGNGNSPELTTHYPPVVGFYHNNVRRT